MTNRFLISSFPLATLAIAAASNAFAVEYLTVEAAQRLMFPSASNFILERPKITPEQLRTIDASTHATSQARQFLVFCAEADQRSLGRVYVDEVIGKSELITYAVAITPDGAIKQVEILAYRESHGYEVRDPRWRAQFIGKRAASPLALNDDISNISGATLSSRHVTNGVRRIVAIDAWLRSDGT